MGFRFPGWPWRLQASEEVALERFGEEEVVRARAGTQNVLGGVTWDKALSLGLFEVFRKVRD